MKKILPIILSAFLLTGCDLLMPQRGPINDDPISEASKSEESSESKKESKESVGPTSHESHTESQETSYYSEESSDPEYYEEWRDGIRITLLTGKGAEVGLGSFSDLPEIVEGTIVNGVGIITGFSYIRKMNDTYTCGYVFVKDMASRFTIMLYFSGDCCFYNQSVIGKPINFTGEKHTYLGMAEVRYPDYIIDIDDTATHTIYKYDLNLLNEQLNLEEYTYKNTRLTVTVKESTGGILRFNETPYEARYMYFYENRPQPGDVISFDAWIFPRDSSYVIYGDYNYVTKLN